MRGAEEKHRKIWDSIFAQERTKAACKPGMQSIYNILSSSLRKKKQISKRLANRLISTNIKRFMLISAVMLKAACLVFSSVDKSFRINHNLLFPSLPIVAKLKKILIFKRDFQPECNNVTIVQCSMGQSFN